MKRAVSAIASRGSAAKPNRAPVVLADESSAVLSWLEGFSLAEDLRLQLLFVPRSHLVLQLTVWAEFEVLLPSSATLRQLPWSGVFFCEVKYIQHTAGGWRQARGSEVAANVHADTHFLHITKGRGYSRILGAQISDGLHTRKGAAEGSCQHSPKCPYHDSHVVPTSL